MENKNRGNEKKTFGDFNCTMDKMDRDSGKKAQIIYRCGSKLGSSSYEKRRTQIPLSSATMIDPLGQDKIQARSLLR